MTGFTIWKAVSCGGVVSLDRAGPSDRTSVTKVVIARKPILVVERFIVAPPRAPRPRWSASPIQAPRFIGYLRQLDSPRVRSGCGHELLEREAVVAVRSHILLCRHELVRLSRELLRCARVAGELELRVAADPLPHQARDLVEASALLLR